MEMYFQDPIIIAAALVIVITGTILAWALKNLQAIDSQNEEMPYEEPQEEQQQRQNDNSGLAEARINEIGSQLNQICRQLDGIERSSAENKPSTNALPLEQIDNIAIKLDSLSTKLDAMLSSHPASNKEDMERIEAKLDAVRKLLVLLSDSNKPEE
jgi:hypothetical protein